MREKKTLDRDNASIYAELLVEELAKQVGIKNAHYDLYTKDGKIGVLSECILADNEEMFTLDSLVGEGTEFTNSPGSFDSIKLQENMIDFLKKEGCSKEKIKGVLTNFQKKMIFDIFCLNIDNHTENISFLTTNNNGEMDIDIAPNYDNELSLMLDTDIESLKEAENDSCLFDVYYTGIVPRIAVADDETEYENSDDIWKDSLSFYCENSESNKFAQDCYNNMDISKAIQNVEKRIGASIPTYVKSIVTMAFNRRKNEISQELEFDFEKANQLT